MRKLLLNPFLQLLFFVVFLFGIATYLSNSNKSIQMIDLDQYPQNDSLVYEIEAIYDQGEYLEIVGYAFDIQNRYAFNNYITGSGENLYVNVDLVLNNDRVAYLLSTTPRYTNAVGTIGSINLHHFGFMAKVSKQYLKEDVYSLAFLSRDINGNESVLITDEVINHE